TSEVDHRDRKRRPERRGDQYSAQNERDVDLVDEKAGCAVGGNGDDDRVETAVRAPCPVIGHDSDLHKGASVAPELKSDVPLASGVDRTDAVYHRRLGWTGDLSEADLQRRIRRGLDR